MWNYNYSNELYHYGIQGMRWGKRKAKTNSSNSKNTKKSKNQNGNKKNKKLKTGTILGTMALATIGGLAIKDISSGDKSLLKTTYNINKDVYGMIKKNNGGKLPKMSLKEIKDIGKINDILAADMVERARRNK